MHHELPEILPGRHYLAWITGGFLAGVFYGIYGKALPAIPFSGLLLYSAVFLLAALLLFVLCGLPQKAKPLRRDFVLVWLIFLAFMLGIGRVYIFDLLQSRSLKATAGVEHRYTGVLLEIPEESSTGATLGATVQVTRVELDDSTVPVGGKIVLYAKAEQYHGAADGDTIVFTACLQDPARASYSGGFDYRLHLYRQGILYSVYTTDLEKAENPVTLHSLAYRIERLGKTLQSSVFSAIDASFGPRAEEAALLKGILLGNRQSFTDAQYQNFTDSGLVHITAASGMHVMFLFSFLAFVLRRLRLPRWLVRLIAAPVLLLFGAAAAFTPSICRAIIMMLLVLLASQLQRQPDTLTSLSFAALVLAIFNPYIITGYSFLLSFSATLGIVVFSMPLTRAVSRLGRRSNDVSKKKKRSPLRFLWEEIQSSTLLSLASSLGLGYFTARFFNRLSWGSILGNILIVPLASLSFVGGLILWIVSILYQPVATYLAQRILWIPLWLMNRLADFFSLKFFRFYLPTPHGSGLVVYLFLCGVLYYYLTSYKRQKKS